VGLQTSLKVAFILERRLPPPSHFTHKSVTGTLCSKAAASLGISLGSAFLLSVSFPPLQSLWGLNTPHPAHPAASEAAACLQVHCPAHRDEPALTPKQQQQPVLPLLHKHLEPSSEHSMGSSSEAACRLQPLMHTAHGSPASAQNPQGRGPSALSVLMTATSLEVTRSRNCTQSCSQMFQKTAQQ